MTLSTVTLFKEDFPDTTFTDQHITLNLSLATDILENYCNRQFESQEYIESVNGVGDNYIILPNYPITKISDISPDLYDGIKISVDNTIYSVGYAISNTSIIFTSIDFDGVEVETELTYATYPRMSQLSTAINSISGLSTELSTQYENEPSKKLKKDYGMIIGGQTDYLQFYKIDLQLKYSVKNKTVDVVEVNRNLYNSTYIRYTAGYVFPDDISIPAISGTVPRDLSYVCNKLANLMLNSSVQDYTNPDLKSESLGDYSYTKFSKDTSSVISLMADEDKILSRYIRKTLTF